jgi:hypothetical protein
MFVLSITNHEIKVLQHYLSFYIFNSIKKKIRRNSYHFVFKFSIEMYVFRGEYQYFTAIYVIIYNISFTQDSIFI